MQISFCLRNPHSHLEKKFIKNILSDKVYAPYKVLYAMIDIQLIVFICEVLICTFLIGEQHYHDLTHAFHLEAYQNHQIEH